MSNSQTTYQKREICLLDIHHEIKKQDIDEILNKKYRVTFSKIEKRLNVEFKTAAIAREVFKYLENKEIAYHDKPIKFSLKGNRFLVDGMLDVSFAEIRNLFAQWGDVNNVYTTQKYFATLASISQAIELVEKIGFLQINKTRVEIKYAFDRNIGFGNSSNKNFKIKDKESSKFPSTTSLDTISKCNRPIIKLGEPIIQTSKPLIELGNSAVDSSNDWRNVNNHGINKNVPSRFKSKNEENAKKMYYQPKHKLLQSNNPSTCNDGQPVDKNNVKKNQQQQSITTSNLPNQTSIKMIPNPLVQTIIGTQKTENLKSQEPKQQAKSSTVLVQKQATYVQANSLKSNQNLPLFAKDSTTSPKTTSVTDESKKPVSFSSLSKLNYLDPNFKSTDYLENKTKGQVHTTTTYYSNVKNTDPIQLRDPLSIGQKKLPDKLSKMTVGENQNPVKSDQYLETNSNSIYSTRYGCTRVNDQPRVTEPNAFEKSNPNFKPPDTTTKRQETWPTSIDRPSISRDFRTQTSPKNGKDCVIS